MARNRFVKALATGLPHKEAVEEQTAQARNLTSLGGGSTHYITVQKARGGYRVELWKRGK